MPSLCTQTRFKTFSSLFLNLSHLRSPGRERRRSPHMKILFWAVVQCLLRTLALYPLRERGSKWLLLFNPQYLHFLDRYMKIISGAAVHFLCILALLPRARGPRMQNGFFSLKSSISIPPDRYMKTLIWPAVQYFLFLFSCIPTRRKDEKEVQKRFTSSLSLTLSSLHSQAEGEE